MIYRRLFIIVLFLTNIEGKGITIVGDLQQKIAMSKANFLAKKVCRYLNKKIDQVNKIDPTAIHSISYKSSPTIAGESPALLIAVGVESLPYVSQYKAVNKKGFVVYMGDSISAQFREHLMNVDVFVVSPTLITNSELKWLNKNKKVLIPGVENPNMYKAEYRMCLQKRFFDDIKKPLLVLIFPKKWNSNKASLNYESKVLARNAVATARSNNLFLVVMSSENSSKPGNVFEKELNRQGFNDREHFVLYKKNMDKVLIGALLDLGGQIMLPVGNSALIKKCSSIVKKVIIYTTSTMSKDQFNKVRVLREYGYNIAEYDNGYRSVAAVPKVNIDRLYKQVASRYTSVLN